ncbi:hypothetical protein ACIQZO_10530 [Streptomyces sp. NPDC097617]|uniref:hypothetical protein n=1 Tax=Streptomyces sp. NPDC097617 TaxID=3366091 RepID=UPI00381BFD81
MLQLALAKAVVIVAAALYGGLGLRWWLRARLRRGILARVAVLELDPYHAAALTYEKTGAAAAELMLGGYLDIDAAGAVRLTEAGRDPGRTPVEAVPAALLEAVRRYDPEPVSLGWIDTYDGEYQERCLAYRSERDALLPPIPRMPDWDGRQPWACCGCLGFVALLFFWLLAAEMLVLSRPHGLQGWSAATVAAAGLAALGFSPAAGRAVRARTTCADPMGDRLRAESHPAPAALDERQRLHILTSEGDRDRWRGVDQPDVDEAEAGEDDEDDNDFEGWTDDDFWWVDAYHHRAADHEEDGPDGVKPL